MKNIPRIFELLNILFSLIYQKLSGAGLSKKLSVIDKWQLSIKPYS
jgi:hypothetical protein